jgi:hypothetical protein
MQSLDICGWFVCHQGDHKTCVEMVEPIRLAIEQILLAVRGQIDIKTRHQN